MSTTFIIKPMTELEAGPFAKAWDDVANQAHTMAQAKGFWDTERNTGEAIALIHSELSELLESLRDGNPMSEKIGDKGFTQAEEEAADVVIRLMDLAEAKSWDVGAAVAAKLKYNATRPHKHGRAF